MATLDKLIVRFTVKDPDDDDDFGIALAIATQADGRFLIVKRLKIKGTHGLGSQDKGYSWLDIGQAAFPSVIEALRYARTAYLCGDRFDGTASKGPVDFKPDIKKAAAQAKAAAELAKKLNG